MKYIRKYYKRRYWFRPRKILPTTPQENNKSDFKIKLLLIKKLYDNYGSLQKVADDLNVTRERIRQLLVKGDYYKLYKYETTHIQDFKKIKEKISKEILIGILKNETSKFKICKILSLNMRNLYKLIKFYNIDLEDYRQDIRQRKFLMEYSDIVNKLGHHPSTTEMNSIPDWRNTWMGIDRIWGSIEDFRKEFGIEKPPFHFHPNTTLAFQKRRAEMKQNRENNMNNLIKFMQVHKKPVGIKDILFKMGVGRITAYSYLRELRNRGMVNKTGLRLSDTKYRLTSLGVNSEK